MAILTPSQLQAASNATYFDNTSGSITPTAVRTLNDNWISSSILATQTGSMSVASASIAGTASFALNFNPSATASYALQALNANNATLADTATFASNANTANSANTAVSASNATTANTAAFATTASFALNFNPAATASYALFAVTASYALNSVAPFPFTGSARITGSLTMAGLSPVNVSHVKANDVQGVEILTNTGNTVATFGAGGGTGVTVVGQVNATSFSGSGALISGVVSSSRATSAANADNATSASYASNAELLDNLNFTAFVLTSSFTPFSSSIAGRTSIIETTYATTGSNTFTGINNFNTISASFVNVLSASIDYLYVLYQTSSIVYSSGSNQFGDAANDTQTLWGTVDVVTGPLTLTGSLSTTGSITTSGELFVNNDLKISKGGGAVLSNIAIGYEPLKFNTTAIGQTAVGYYALSQYQATGTGYNVAVGYLALSQLGLGGGFANTAVNNNVVVGGNSGTIITSGSRNTIVGSSAFQNANNTERNSGLGRGVLNALATPGSKYNTAIGHNAAFALTSGSNNIIIVGGSVSGEGLTDGQNNTLIGMDTGVPTLLNNTTVLGKGYAGTLINNSVVVTDGQGNIAFEKLGATGSLNIPSNLKITGSVNGNVTSASIASNTSSIDFSLGNFYTSLVSGSTNFNITNPKPGQTVNLLLSTVGAATASFSSNVKQVSGSAYTPTSGSGKNDVLTFISFDGTSVYLANVKNLI